MRKISRLRKPVRISAVFLIGTVAPNQVDQNTVADDAVHGMTAGEGISSLFDQTGGQFRPRPLKNFFYQLVDSVDAREMTAKGIPIFRLVFGTISRISAKTVMVCQFPI